MHNWTDVKKVSTSTVWRKHCEAGQYGRIDVKKLLLRKQNNVKRLHDEILNGRKSLKSSFENDFEQSLNVFCLHFLFVFFSSIIGYLKVKRIKVKKKLFIHVKIIIAFCVRNVYFGRFSKSKTLKLILKYFSQQLVSYKTKLVTVYKEEKWNRLIWKVSVY